MTPQLPNDPDELRRVSDALLASAIPDDMVETDGIVDIVQLIARGVLESALECADDPDTVRSVVRLAAVRIVNVGDDPRNDSRGIGAVSLSEFAHTGAPLEAIARYRPTDRSEYLSCARIVPNESGTPWACVVLLAGICPEEAGEQAGEPFVIVAHAHKNDAGDIETNGQNAESLLEESGAPSDLVDTVKALYAMARRSA